MSYFKCQRCGNERTEDNCDYCNWKGDEGFGKAMKEILKKEKKEKVMSKNEFFDYVMDNFKVFTSDLERAFQEEINSMKRNEDILFENGKPLTDPEIKEKVIQRCLYWLSLERMEIKPEHLLTYRAAALYFQGIEPKNTKISEKEGIEVLRK